MAKYVNADEMLKEYEHGIYDTTDLAEMLYYMPAADVEEVVRCKDCINWKDSVPWTTCSFLGGHWEADMYCSYGERKDG